MQIFGNQYSYIDTFVDKYFSNVSINILMLAMATLSVYRRINFIIFKHKKDSWKFHTSVKLYENGKDVKSDKSSCNLRQIMY